MPKNVRSPAGGTAGPLGNVFVGTVDSFQIAPRPTEIQTQRIARRFGFSPAVAATIAALAYGEARA